MENHYSDYSKAEEKLLIELGYGYLLNKVSIIEIYKMTVEACFINNEQGPAVEALRRGYRAIVECSVYRGTEEFDKLLEFEYSMSTSNRKFGSHRKDVHTEHCCIVHGCKYGEKDCSVTMGIKPQSYPCEYCEEALFDEPKNYYFQDYSI